LGIYYLHDSNGGRKNEKIAINYLRSAAEENVPEAQLNYGLCILLGKGDLEKNKFESFEWIKKAAENNMDDAQYLVGYEYMRGELYEIDYEEGYKWLRKAAENGNHEACLCVADCYHTGRGVEVDREKSRYWLQLAVDNGNAEAQNLLDTFDEIGVENNNVTNLDFGVTAEEEALKLNAMLQSYNQLTDNLKTIFRETITGSSHIFDKSVSELINKDETVEIEFKETFSVPSQTARDQSIVNQADIRLAALKEITGFLNTNDGVLLIGVKDAKNTQSGRPEISGIENDNLNGDQDGYSRMLTDIISNALGQHAASLVSISFEEIENRTVCRIHCKKSDRPVFCTFRNIRRDPYIRIGTSTTKPPYDDWTDWVRSKFPENP